MKKINVHSFGFKVTTITMVLLIVPLLILGYFSFTKIYRIIYDNLSFTSNQIIVQSNLTMDEFLNTADSQVRAMSRNPGFQNWTQNESLATLSHLKDIVESNEDFLNAYYATSDKQIVIYPEAKFDKDYDPTQRPWYKEAVKNTESSVWTDPYQDKATNKYVVTVAKAVLKDGKVVGVFAMDISLDSLTTKIVQAKLGSNGYVYVGDRNGAIIAHPDKSIVGTNAMAKQSYWSEVSSKSSGFVEYTYENQRKFASYTTNTRTGWKIVGVMEYSEITKDTNSVLKLTGIIIVLGVLVAGSLLILVTRLLSRGIQQLRDKFELASHGDLTVRTNISARDEIGDLSRSFNEMMSSISSLVSNVSNSTKVVTDTSGLLADSSEQAVAAVNEVAKSIEEVAHGTTEQAKDTQNAMDLADELDKSLSSVTHAIDNVLESFSNVAKMNDEGLSKMDTLSSAIEDTILKTVDVSDKVNEVDKSSKDISVILEAIRGIADQTNLLSLNAQIEAARAGDAGKGFAVVANEVKKLAEECKHSAEEISNIISNIQSQSNEAVIKMRDTDAVTAKQAALIIETRDTFNSITEAIKNFTIKLQGVKKLNDTMISKKQDIVNSVSNIAAAAQESSASAEEISASTEEQLAIMSEVSSSATQLESLAKELEKSVKQFKI